ncbi:dihydroxy-acid dehydratase [Citricoccus parietis]|uniref:Dihydroxy-acid dehydratase n=1 Tax=Citricoccus parietis TaxID=592307 RepID=A0ABV6F1M1_9MICC
MSRPKVAIINSSSDMAACFSHLDDIVPVLKQHLRDEGLLPFEVSTIAPSDFITSAGRGGRYVLPSRDLIVNSIEAIVEGAQLDGMICLSSCDKTAPAHMMAAGRLDIPTVIVSCGYQRNALNEDGGADIEEVFLRASHGTQGNGGIDDLMELSEDAIRGPGVCAGLGTANSMHIAAEALGMAVSGSTPVRANSAKMWQSVASSAAALARLVKTNTTPRQVITPESVENAVRVMLSIGASINSVKHLQAIAREAGLTVDVWRLFRELGPKVPVLTAVRPNGPSRVEEFEDVGGAAVVLRELAPQLHLDALTVDGGTLADCVKAAPAADGSVIAPYGSPMSDQPSIRIVRGNLAADGAIVKLPVLEERARSFSGPARIFHSREEGIEALANGIVNAGDVVVLRGIGLVGGPGMGMASALVFALDGSGLGDQVAVVTDGQLSGLVNKGIVVGEVSPEAATGGLIGLLQDGDLIDIDLDRGTVDARLTADQIMARPAFEPVDAVRTDGLLDTYREVVTPLACGAVMCGVAAANGCSTGRGIHHGD